MSTTRESMRREFKELAKLAETMGKPSADAVLASEASGPEFPRDTLERPVTPASASRVSVPPVATPMMPPVYDLGESKKGSRKRTGLIVTLAGAALAAAVVGGVMVGKSLAGGSTASAAPVDVRGAAAVAAPPAVTALPSAIAPVAQAPADSPPVAVAVKAAPPPAAVAPVAAPVHKHIARPVTASTSGFTPKAASASNSAAVSPTGNDSAAAAKPAAAPAFAKPAAAKPAAASGGGGDSLEDLIRKEVAAQKK